MLDSSLPHCAPAERLRRAHRQNTGSWLADARNSPVGAYDFCCCLIGRRSTVDCSRDFWDEHGEWRTLHLCSRPSLWTDEDWIWLQQHRRGVFTYLDWLSVVCLFVCLFVCLVVCLFGSFEW